MNFVMNHAPGARSIKRHVDQQSSELGLCYGFPLLPEKHVELALKQHAFLGYDE